MSIQISKSPTLSTTGDLDVKEVREDGGKRSVNFGPGMEMFMNGKKNSRPNSEGSKSGSRGATPDIELDDIDKMEKDLTKDEPLKIQGNEGFNKVISSSNITSSLSSGRSLTPQANSGLNTRTFSGSDEQVKTQASSQEKIINLNQSSDNNQTKGSNEINKEEKLKDTKIKWKFWIYVTSWTWRFKSRTSKIRIFIQKR